LEDRLLVRFVEGIILNSNAKSQGERFFHQLMQQCEISFLQSKFVNDFYDFLKSIQLP